MYKHHAYIIMVLIMKAYLEQTLGGALLRCAVENTAVQQLSTTAVEHTAAVLVPSHHVLLWHERIRWAGRQGTALQVGWWGLQEGHEQRSTSSHRDCRIA
jgi:hypothetical protein